MGPDGSLAQGDVVATGGRWWATWREHVAPGGGPGDEFDQTELFQAYTVGGTYSPREPVTTNPAWDSAPSLALTPATTFPVRLVWARGGSDFEAADVDLRRALGNQDGDWVSASLTTAGQVVVGWTTQAPFRAFVAERAGTTWSGRVASPAGVTRLQLLTGVSARGGTAGASILSLGSRLYAATES